MQECQVDDFDFGGQRIEDGQTDFGHVAFHPLERHHVRVARLSAELNRGEEEHPRVLFVMSRVLIPARLEVRRKGDWLEGHDLRDLVHPDRRQQKPVVQDDGSVLLVTLPRCQSAELSAER